MKNNNSVALKIKAYKILNLKKFFSFLLIISIIVNVTIIAIDKMVIKAFNTGATAPKIEKALKTEDNGSNWEVDYITTSPDKSVYYYHMTDGSIQTYYCQSN